MQRRAYAQAGVDIELANKVKEELPRLLRSTHRRGVLGKVGGFGGLFALDTTRYREPVLVSSVDGVGTKLKIAFAVGRHDTVGQDLVNHCINDIAVLGAEPLYFLDYLAMARLEPTVFLDLIRGFAKACRENRCALIGGETAQMPGFYQEGEYDVSGMIVGVVERSKILTGKEIRKGDVLIGIRSNGLHTNGYSLARKVFLEQAKWPLDRYVEEFGCTLAEELLRIHLSYGPLIQSLLKRFNQQERMIRAIAHITGGGFLDNIPRVLPSQYGVILRKGSWPVPPVFQLIQKLGQVEEGEMYHVFNMGIGMVLIVASDRAEEILRWVKRREPAWIIGEVIRGSHGVQIE